MIVVKNLKFKMGGGCYLSNTTPYQQERRKIFNFSSFLFSKSGGRL
jgi:hypothetical protein